MKNFGRNILIFFTVLLVLTFSGVILFYFGFKFLGKLKRERIFKRLKTEVAEDYIGKNFFHKDYNEPVKDKVSVEKSLVIKKSNSNKKPIKSKTLTSQFNDRQSELLNYLKRNKHANMIEVQDLFENVTQRTLRRDFEKLEKEGVIKQIGTTRNSTYILV